MDGVDCAGEDEVGRVVRYRWARHLCKQHRDVLEMFFISIVISDEAMHVGRYVDEAQRLVGHRMGDLHPWEG